MRLLLCALVLVGCGGSNSPPAQTPATTTSTSSSAPATEPSAEPIDPRKRAAIEAHLAHLNNLVSGNAAAMSAVFADDYQYAPDGKEPMSSDTRVEVYEKYFASEDYGQTFAGKKVEDLFAIDQAEAHTRDEPATGSSVWARASAEMAWVGFDMEADDLFVYIPPTDDGEWWAVWREISGQWRIVASP